MTKEWQEASNERAKEMRINPISGTFSCSRVTSNALTVLFRYIVRGLQGQGLRYAGQVIARIQFSTAFCCWNNTLFLYAPRQPCGRVKTLCDVGYRIRRRRRTAICYHMWGTRRTVSYDPWPAMAGQPRKSIIYL